jgi:tRNA nucleotidyltransferase (CCA-adding enzyme)
MKDIIEQVKTLLPNKIRAYLVGGCIRDFLLKSKPKDIDVEVFGVNVNELEEILAPHGKVTVRGKSFGIINLISPNGKEYDFSLPRRDNKCGVGHKDFRIEVDSSMSIKEAASRRDFTINCMSIDIWTGNLFDPFDGQKDLTNGILRHIGPSFKDDPLRVIRGFQFCGRYNLTATTETVELCNNLKEEFTTLPVERIWMEWEKWAAKSIKPSTGLRFLKSCGWISHFPELDSLTGCPQDPEWHPEGDVFEHTCQVVDHAARSNIVVLLAALCHDLGKSETTAFSDGHIRSIGHCQAGVEKSKSFLKRIGCPDNIISQVKPLVAEHLAHLQPVTYRTIRRLIVRLGNASIEDLISLIGADHAGRGTASSSLPKSAIEMKEIADEIGEEIKPIIMGRHLIDLGMKPGPHFGPILKSVFEAQLDGKFETVEDGIEYLKLILRGE